MELFVQTLKGTKQQFHGIIQMISATKTSFINLICKDYLNDMASQMVMGLTNNKLISNLNCRKSFGIFVIE